MAAYPLFLDEDGSVFSNPVNLLTTESSVLGSLFYGTGTGTPEEFGLVDPNTEATKKFLSMTGTGSAGAVPVWETVTKTDVGLGSVENTALSTWAGSTNITTVGAVTATSVNGLIFDDYELGFTITGGTSPGTLTTFGNCSVSGTNTGDVVRFGQDYITISGSGQSLTANPVNLSGTHVTSTLPVAKGGTGTTTTGGIRTALGLSTSDTPSFAQVVLAGDPASSLQAATKQYVDNIVGSVVAGLSVKASCKVATTAALTATYSNGTSGVNATLTNSGTQAALSIDGVSLSLNDRVLVKNQSTQTQNGIYTVTTVGSGSVNWVLRRATDYDSGAEIGEGSYTIVDDGTVNGSNMFIMTTPGPITVGSSNIVFNSYNSAANINNGAGLDKTGNTFSVATGGITNAMLAGSIAASKLVGTDISVVGTLTTGTWQAGVIAGQYGGTGVNNSGKSFTLGGNLTTSGAYASTFTMTGTTTVTFPTSGTLATTGNTVASVSGTANQVYVNGDYSNPTTGAVVLTLDQDISQSSGPQFAKLGIGTPAPGATGVIASAARLTTSSAGAFLINLSHSPLFTFNSGATSSQAYGSLIGSDLTVNTGASVLQAFNTAFTAPTKGGAGDVTSLTTVAIFAPTGATTNNLALYADNLGIGYSNTPPTNGAVISGTVGIGTPSPIGKLSNTNANWAPIVSGSGIASNGLAWSDAGNGWVGLIRNTDDTSGSSGLGISTANTGTGTYVLSVQSGGIGRFSIRADGLASLSGELSFTSAGKTLRMATGSNACKGTATLTSGTVTVSTTAVATGDFVRIQRRTTSGTVGHLTYTISNGTSFTINSTSATDAGAMDWWIIK